MTSNVADPKHTSSSVNPKTMVYLVHAGQMVGKNEGKIFEICLLDCGSLLPLLGSQPAAAGPREQLRYQQAGWGKRQQAAADQEVITPPVLPSARREDRR